MRRNSSFVLLGLLLTLTVACTNKKSVNPLANVGSKQPDKVLFDRAMDAMKHNRFDVSRMTLQTLINTYPDSEFIARAKLAVADSWYAEGGTTAMQQAEIEYKDFRTFFPNMPEAAEAQLKVANIHYQEMEKADRDFTHAMRAEEEYRSLIQEYPDSKLVPEAKQRLREVQEVLAQREFNIGRFYYLRLAYPAAIARLKTLVDRYPLYSGADEALYLLGQSYEGEIDVIRKNGRMNEVSKDEDDRGTNERGVGGVREDHQAVSGDGPGARREGAARGFASAGAAANAGGSRTKQKGSGEPPASGDHVEHAGEFREASRRCQSLACGRSDYGGSSAVPILAMWCGRSKRGGNGGRRQ